MAMQTRLSWTVKGRRELIVGGDCDWEGFPSIADAIIERYHMTLTHRIENPYERFWIARMGESTFGIAFDSTRGEVAVIAWDGTDDGAVESLATR